MQLTENVLTKIKSANDRLNKLHGWDSNDVSEYVETLVKNGQVEVGYRAQCGSTHLTQKVYREFSKIVQVLRKDGMDIVEESVNHSNRYATNNGGYWNSSIFKVK